VGFSQLTHSKNVSPTVSKESTIFRLFLFGDMEVFRLLMFRMTILEGIRVLPEVAGVLGHLSSFPTCRHSGHGMITNNDGTLLPSRC